MLRKLLMIKNVKLVLVSSQLCTLRGYTGYTKSC